MKRIVLFIFVGFFYTINSKGQLSSTMDTLSYAIGVNIGQNFKVQGLEPNLDFVRQAINEVLSGDSLVLNAQESNAYIQSYFRNEMKKKADENLKKGKAFLKENRTREGVMETASGLQYEVLTLGTGPKPDSTSKVKVHYHGTLLDGQVFDSSVDRGEPSSFNVNGVIKGWIEGIKLMPVGSKYKFFIPAELAYGERGTRGAIGPNELLIFEVELIDIIVKED